MIVVYYQLSRNLDIFIKEITINLTMIPVINKLLFIKSYLFSCTRIDRKIQNTEEMPLHNTESTDNPLQRFKMFMLRCSPGTEC
jgi:predicted transcriptional regulator